MNGPRPFPSFLADALSLDFLNAISPPPDKRYAPLASGHDLVAWLEEANIVPSDALRGLIEMAVPGELDALVARARALGEWFRGLVLKYKGAPLPSEAVRELVPLNRILERDLRFHQIEIDDLGAGTRKVSSLAFRIQRQWRSTDSLLLPLAQSMGELVCNDDFSNIRMCEGAACTLLFLDRTRGRGRRWCSMAVCGNRAKQAVRRNNREEHSPSDT